MANFTNEIKCSSVSKSIDTGFTYVGIPYLSSLYTLWISA